MRFSTDHLHFSSSLSLQAELMFGLGQTKKKKESEANKRTWKANLKDVNITETVESNVRGTQHDREKNEKAARRTTKDNLKDVNITDTIESDVRKEQNTREKQWKVTGRNQVKTNSKFDMARSLFGGGGTALEPEPNHDKKNDDNDDKIIEKEYVEEEIIEDDSVEEEVIEE